MKPFVIHTLKLGVTASLDQRTVRQPHKRRKKQKIALRMDT